MNPAANLLQPSHDDHNFNELQQIVEGTIDERAKQQILQILDKISLLKPHERFLLYLRMPGSSTKSDPLKQSQNPLGTRSEINHTINWVKTHLEHDPNVSIPKQDVYDDYELYCNQVNIKPLSTADFGKVMKQIFPNIRPRRLGTRGNSRYCYAALRKTTKLTPPQLPDIQQINVPRMLSYSSIPAGLIEDDSSLHVVKKWAEEFFFVKFETMKDLAEYLTVNNGVKSMDFNTQQQKLGVSKERGSRRTNETNTIKRRKKRRTRKASFRSAATLKSSTVTTSTSMPMMAITKTESHTTIPNLDTVESASNVNLLKSAIQPPSTSTVIATKLEPITSMYAPTKIRDNFVENTANMETHSTVVCKKVKQAQQTKTMLHTAAPPLLMEPVKLERIIDPIETTINLMGPPENKSDLVRSGQFFDVETNDKSNKRHCRLSRDSSSSITKSEAADDIVTNINIPRERVISICNLDKDALDDYLIDENNSQEQEAELLKYFHNDADDSSSSDQIVDSETNRLNISLNSLENSSIPLNHPMSKVRGTDNRNYDQISELRQCLQQSLSALSNVDTKPTLQLPKVENVSTKMEILNNRKMVAATHPSVYNASRDTRRKYTVSDKQPKSIPQSPNTRRKNFTFVPISPGPQSPRHTFHYQNEISPKRITTRQSMAHYVPPQYNVQRFSNNDATFTRLKDDISFSAPSSPLLPMRAMNPIEHATKYNNNSQMNYAMHPQQHQHQQQTECIESRSQSVPLHRQCSTFRNIPKYDAYSVSHSIAQTPVPQDFTDFGDDNFLSSILAGSAVDPSNIKVETNPIPTDIPMVSIPNYSADLATAISFQNDPSSSYGNYYNASRSVPSTPQPVLTVNTHKIAPFDISKSVPTTPIHVTTATGGAFRYTPEPNRDFLINGNTIDPCLTASLYSPQNPRGGGVIIVPGTSSSVALDSSADDNSNNTKQFNDDIEELTTFGDTADPIVGSDLLNNL